MENYVFSYFDLAPYILLTILILVLSKIKDTPTKKTNLLYYILLVFCSIRYGVGYDYLEYKELIVSERIDYAFDRIEPLGQALIIFARHTHYQVFFILTSIVVLYPLFYVIKKESKDPVLSSLIYIFNPMYFLEGIGAVRNAMAYSFVFLAGYLLLKKKLWQSVVCVFIACGFHSSSLIAFIIYPLYFLKFSYTINIIGYVLSFIITAFIPTILDIVLGGSAYFDIYSHYIEDKDTSGGGSLTIVVNAINILFLFYWRKITSINLKYEKYLLFHNFGICLWNTFIPLSYVFSMRLSSFFCLYSLLLFPCLIATRQRWLSRTSIISVFLMLFLASFYININSHIKNKSDMASLPYQLVFFHKDYSNLDRWR